MQSITSEILSKNGDIPFFDKIHYKDDNLSKSFLKIFNAIDNPESDIQIQSLINLFLTKLIIKYSTSNATIKPIKKQTKFIKKACKYIEENFKENITLDELSEIACLSPFYFQREFKKIVGITPHEYLNDFRIKKSKEMILQSKDIASISVDIGFFDQSHFSKIFKKTVGISPQKYYKINLNSKR